MTVNLEYAITLRDRAQEHLSAFNNLTGPGFWKVEVGQDGVDWIYSLRMDRDALRRAVPILSDCTINIANVLDNVIAAIVRSQDPNKTKAPYFPFRADEREFRVALSELRQVIGAPMAAAIANNHSSHSGCISHMAAIKKIANTSKHWKLMPSSASAHAVALNQPGSPQRFFQIPDDAFKDNDDFVYYRGSDKLPDVPPSIVIGLEVSDLPDSLPKSPDTIIRCALQYVDGLIDEVNNVAQ